MSKEKLTPKLGVDGDGLPFVDFRSFRMWGRLDQILHLNCWIEELKRFRKEARQERNEIETLRQASDAAAMAQDAQQPVVTDPDYHEDTHIAFRVNPVPAPSDSERDAERLNEVLRYLAAQEKTNQSPMRAFGDAVVHGKGGASLQAPPSRCVWQGGTGENRSYLVTECGERYPGSLDSLRGMKMCPYCGQDLVFRTRATLGDGYINMDSKGPGVESSPC